jgi:hypothetical protein
MEPGEPVWHVADMDEPGDGPGDPQDGDPWDEPGPVPEPASGRSRWLMTAVVIGAAAAGVAGGLAFLRLPVWHAAGSPSAQSQSPAASPGGNRGLPGLAPLTGNGDGQLQISLVGDVLAVSSHSITIGGDGSPVTARITGSTTFTGSVTRAGAIKVGTEVAAEITGTGSSLTVTAIQDPVAQ